jgi:hypothetical protein
MVPVSDAVIGVRCVVVAPEAAAVVLELDPQAHTRRRAEIRNGTATTREMDMGPPSRNSRLGIVTVTVGFMS